VLDALGEAATKLRTQLGESLASVQKFDAPLPQETTSSLEALKEGRRPRWDRKTGNALAPSQLPLVAGRRGDSGCRAAKAHAACGHSNHVQHLRGRRHKRDGSGTL
jgi:hypothetical protein